MYYKITNKESEVYKKFYELKQEEHKMAENNKKAVEDAVELEYDRFLGHLGQQNLSRTTEYEGFEFLEPDKVDPKIWKKHKEYKDIFIPNRRTKKGKEMSEFLLNGLEKSCFDVIHDILGLEVYGRFTFPFLEVVGDVIILSIDDDIENPDVIEITKKEFNEYMNLRE